MLGDVSACLYAGGNIRQSSIDPSNLVLSFVGEKLNVPLYNGNVPPHPPTTHNGWCVRGGGQVCSMEGMFLSEGGEDRMNTLYCTQCTALYTCNETL